MRGGGAEMNLLTQTLVYLAAGVIAAPLAKRLKLGSVLGYLIAGLIIGPFALSLVGEQTDVMKFAEFGVVILLFLIGLEVRPALLWSMRKTIFGLGGAQVAVTGLVMAGLGVLLGLAPGVALAAGLILAMSSTAIALQTLEERGMRQGAVGRAAFGVLLMQDLAVIPMFALLPLLAPGGAHHAQDAGGHGGESLIAALPGWAQALSVLAAVAAVVVLGRFIVQPAFRFIAKARLREIFTAAALLIVVGVAALMQSVGMSPALGAFLAGVVLAESEFRRELESDIEPFRGLLLGLFFITVGAGLDLGLVAADPVRLIGLVLGFMTVKFAVITALMRIARAPWRTTAAVATALAQGGEFAFVLLSFTVGAGVVGTDLAARLTAAVALSMALTPPMMTAYERIADKVKARKPARTAPDSEPFESEPEVIIAGYGRFGQVISRLLSSSGFRATVLEADVDQIEILRRFGRPVHFGDATRLDLLRAAGADRARLLIVGIDDKDKATELVETASKAFPDLTIVARAFDRLHAYELLRAGADEVERETFEGALSLGAASLRRLGLRSRQAHRAVASFRGHDRHMFEELAPAWAGDLDEAYILASREAALTMERLLTADLAQLRPDGVDSWNLESLEAELRDKAKR
jgi:glutathione-regulated potassium-efflux system ancillary protein KefC/glutathione-regulated potassium-efflux system protein KefB